MLQKGSEGMKPRKIGWKSSFCHFGWFYRLRKKYFHIIVPLTPHKNPMR